MITSSAKQINDRPRSSRVGPMNVRKKHLLIEHSVNRHHVCQLTTTPVQREPPSKSNPIEDLLDLDGYRQRPSYETRGAVRQPSLVARLFKSVSESEQIKLGELTADHFESDR